MPEIFSILGEQDADFQAKIKRLAMRSRLGVAALQSLAHAANNFRQSDISAGRLFRDTLQRQACS